MISAIFDEEVIPMLSTTFQVNQPFSLGEKAKKKKDFQDGRQLLLIYKSLRCFLPSFKSIGLSVQKK